MTMEDVNDDTARPNAKSFDEEDDDSSDEGGHLRKRTWEESFALLVAYREKHGNCHVPIRFDADRRLGRWVYSQRLRKDKLTADQIRRLEELGFEEEHSDDENDHKGDHAKATPSHEEDEDDEDSPNPSSFEDELAGFTHTGRRRKAVKRYGITDNDDQSDIARRRKDPDPHPKQAAQKTNGKTSHKNMPPPKPRKVTASPPPPVAPPTPPPAMEEVDDDKEDPDYDSAEERRAREKRRKQRQQQAAASNSKRGRPKGRPRGRPRKETLEEKLSQIVVGSRVAVLWPAENEYYRASVAKIVETRKRPYYLEYDDGETEWIDFGTGQTEFLVLTPRTGPRKRNRSKAAATGTASAPARPTTPTNTSRSAATAAPRSGSHNPKRPPIRIGARVSVYWSDDEQYYEATVVKERVDKNHPEPHKLEYEDGEYEWIDLHQVKFKLLDADADDADDMHSPVRKSGRTRRLPSRMRDGDDSGSSSSDGDDDEDDDLEDEAPTSSARVKVLKDNDSDDDDDEPERKKTIQDSSSSDSSGSSSSVSSSSDDSDIELVSDVRQVQLGSRVAVYWSDHERYYEGTVTEHRRGHPMPFFMQYDDGDSQWIDLRRRNFCLLKKICRRKQKRKKRSNKRSKHRALDDSSDSSDSSIDERERRGFTLRKPNNRQPANHYGNRKRVGETTSESSDTTDDDQALHYSHASVALNDPFAEMHVGTRVTVFCPVKNRYMDGTVTHRQIARSYRKKPCYFVEYDKGHSEWIELPKRKVRLLKSAETPISARKPAKRGRKKVHDSPLVRLLREKELRKANPDLIQGMDIDEPSSRSFEEEEKPEAVESSSSSEESEDLITSEDSSDESESEEATPSKEQLADQIGIGSRVAVQCPKELKFMEGTVTRLIRNRRKPFFVEYDIGGFEWIDVHCSLVKILTDEEENLLKKQSAILVKEAIVVTGNIVQPDSSDERDYEEAKAKAARRRKQDEEAQAAKRRKQDDAMDIDKPVTPIEPEQTKMTDMKEIVDEDPDQSPPSPVIAEDERRKPTSVSNDGGADAVEETTLPSLQDEDAGNTTNCVDAVAPEVATILPPSTTTLVTATDAAEKPGVLRVKKIEIPRVSDSDGASATDKDSPTAVTCVLGSAAAEKIVNGVVSKPLIESGKIAASLPKCILLKATSDGFTDKAEGPCALNNSSSAVDVVRVAPVAIVSDTSTDRLDVLRKLNHGAGKKTNCIAKEVNDTTKFMEGGAGDGIVATADEEQPQRASENMELEVEEQKIDKNLDAEENCPMEKDDEAPETSAPVVRRKRGRPPKSRLVEKQTDDGSESMSVRSRSRSESMDSPRKRGPGRPPKNYHRLHHSGKDDPADSKPDEAPKKRGPGRPRKKTPQSTHESSKKIQLENPINAEETPKKRGPGRPPKSRTIPKAADFVDQESEDESNCLPIVIVKRGPGRPRKSDTEPPKKRGPGRPKSKKSDESKTHTVDLTTEDAKPDIPRKRGPGRPRKHPPPPDSDHPNGAAEAGPMRKRGPGRPRKSESHEPKKRGPGRPRKNSKDEADVVEDIFKVTSVEGARPRKKTDRFSPTTFDESDSDSSVEAGSSPKGRGTPFKKSDFGEDHQRLASQLEVGMRVSVFWGGDQEYYPGTITKTRSYRKKKFYLEYDDGEAEWIDFHRNKFRMLSKPNAAPRKRKSDEADASDDDESKNSAVSLRRRSSENSETDPSNLIRNRMDMADVMLKIQIGCRVEVFWSEDDCYYSGTITKQRDNIITSKKPFYLQYDDGEAEWLDLRDHVFRILEKGDELATPDKVESVDQNNKEKRKREKEAEEASNVKKFKRLKKRKILQD